MKKLLIILLIFCCSKFTLVAQQITSNLTLITKDMMSSQQKDNFNWRNVSYTRPAARFYFPAIYITQEPDEVSGGGSGDNPSAPYAPCNKWGSPERGPISTGSASDINPPIQYCRFCLDDMMDHCALVQTGVGVGSLGSGTSGNTNLPPANNTPFNWSSWGNILWGNLGNYFTTGFLNPPSYVPSGGSYSGYSGGGGSAPPPVGPSYSPPNNPIEVDDPTGWAATPQKKDTIIFDNSPCNDSTSKRIGRRLDKDLQDCRNTNYKVDSLYRYTLNATKGTPEAGITWGTDVITNSIVTSQIFNNNDPAGILLPFSTSYTTDKDLHTHFENGWYFPNIVDVYSLLINTSVRDTGIVTASYITCQDGSIFAITPTDRINLNNFLITYDKFDNVDRSNIIHYGFKEDSELEKYFGYFVGNAIKAGLSQQDALTYGMAYLMESTGMGIGIYKANSIDEPFKKITANINIDGITKKTIISLTKCN